MFDLTPLTSFQLALFLAVFVILFGVLWAVVNYFKPDAQLVPPARVSHAKHSVYYAGSYLVLVITLAGLVALFNEITLLMGLIIGGILVLLIGSVDEQKGMSPPRQLFWQFLIAATVVYFGWTMPHIGNPLGEGIINLEWWSSGNWIFPGSVLAIVWLMFVMNAFNWLDGVDGLAGSISLVVFVTLAAISLLPATQDSRTLSLALIGAAAAAAFLIWNFAPAHVYLGTTGSWFVGLFIGLVAMVGGGKMATVLLVLAIPALDAVLVIGQRLLYGRAPWQGDKQTHLHFKLLQYGLSPRVISILAGVMTAALGATAVFMQTSQKIGLLFLVGLGMLVLTILLYHPSIYRKST